MHKFFLLQQLVFIFIPGKGLIVSIVLLNALAAKWLLHKAKPKGKNLEDFDALLESTRQANMVPEVNQEYFWQAIALTGCDLLETLKKGSLTLEKGDLIAGAYARVGRIASSPRQMRSVMEHVGFLTSVTTELNLPDAEYLDRLHKKLRKMR